MPVFQITHQTNTKLIQMHILTNKRESDTAHRHRTTFSITQSITSSKMHKTGHFDPERYIQHALYNDPHPDSESKTNTVQFM